MPYIVRIREQNFRCRCGGCTPEDANIDESTLEESLKTVLLHENLDYLSFDIDYEGPPLTLGDNAKLEEAKLMLKHYFETCKLIKKLKQDLSDELAREEKFDKLKNEFEPDESFKRQREFERSQREKEYNKLKSEIESKNTEVKK